MTLATPPGITPPSPGQAKEEPELRQEDDIPQDDGKGRASQDEPGRTPQRDERDD